MKHKNNLSKKIKRMLPVEKLEKNKVGVIYHYGSTATGYELKFSDLDLGIIFRDRKVLKNSLDTYSKMYDLLTDYIKFPYELDIVLLQQTSFSLQYQVICEGNVIYEVDSQVRMDYEEYVMKRYFDFKYVINYFDKILMERISK